MIAPILMPLAILGGMDGVEPMGRACDASFECASLHRRRHYLILSAFLRNREHHTKNQ